MEGGVLGVVVVYLVEVEARQELVQTLHQKMEEMIVWDLLVRSVTQMTVLLQEVISSSLLVD